MTEVIEQILYDLEEHDNIRQIWLSPNFIQKVKEEIERDTNISVNVIFAVKNIPVHERYGLKDNVIYYITDDIDDSFRREL